MNLQSWIACTLCYSLHTLRCLPGAHVRSHQAPEPQGTCCHEFACSMLQLVRIALSAWSMYASINRQSCKVCVCSDVSVCKDIFPCTSDMHLVMHGLQSYTNSVLQLARIALSAWRMYASTKCQSRKVRAVMNLRALCATVCAHCAVCLAHVRIHQAPELQGACGQIRQCMKICVVLCIL